jgi:hypothetical protein
MISAPPIQASPSRNFATSPRSTTRRRRPMPIPSSQREFERGFRHRVDDAGAPSPSAPRQPRIARNMGGEDRGETAVLALAGSPAAMRKPETNSSRCSAFRCWLARASQKSGARSREPGALQKRLGELCRRGGNGAGFPRELSFSPLLKPP